MLPTDNDQIIGLISATGSSLARPIIMIFNIIQIALPFIRTDHVFFGKMNMAHGVFPHIHTDPDGIDTFDVIVTRILEILFLLGGDQLLRKGSRFGT